MRRILYAVLVPISLPVFLFGAGDETAKANLEKLQGKFRLEVSRLNMAEPDLLGLLHGITAAKDGKGKEGKGIGVLAVQGDKFTFHGADKLKRLAVGKLGAGKTPWNIDLTVAAGPAKGKTYLGIYRLIEDDLYLCIGKGDSRPSETKISAGQVILRYSRTKG